MRSSGLYLCGYVLRRGCRIRNDSRGAFSTTSRWSLLHSHGLRHCTEFSLQRKVTRFQTTILFVLVEGKGADSSQEKDCHEQGSKPQPPGQGKWHPQSKCLH